MREFRKRAVSALKRARQLFRPAASTAPADSAAPTEALSPADPSDDVTRFVTVSVQSDYVPELEHPEQDHDTFRRLMSLSDSDIPLDDDLFGLNGIRVTPWAAARMGAQLEHITDESRALRAATVAMRASRQAGPPQLAIGNLLSAGNLFCRFGHYDEAAKCFEGILTTPLARGSSERVAAHLGMANIRYIAGEYGEAAWHYDKCLPHLHLIMNEEGRRGILNTAFQSYRQNNEYGGVLYCLHQINPEHSRQFEKRFGELRPSLDTALLTAARLNVLGDSSAAGRLLLAWGITKGKRT
jgi:hypothetical protein